MSSIIQSVSGLVSNPAQSSAAASGVKGPLTVQRPEDRTDTRPVTPEMDEFVPEEKREATGRYWLGRDEEGLPKVYFDDPEQAADKPQGTDEASKAAAPAKRAGEDKKEVCIGSTDQVDRQIEQLKRKRDELERQLRTETDDTKAKALEQQLAQVERELNQKDNDTYRRQHTVFS